MGDIDNKGKLGINERPYPKRNKEGYYRFNLKPYNMFSLDKCFANIYLYRASDRQLYEYFRN